MLANLSRVQVNLSHELVDLRQRNNQLILELEFLRLE